MEVARAYSKTHRISLGRAASELIRRGNHYRIETRMLNGFPVFDVPADFPRITNEQVRKLIEQE